MEAKQQPASKLHERMGHSLVQKVKPAILYMHIDPALFEQIDSDDSLTPEQKLQRKEGALSQIERTTAISGSEWARYYEAIAFLKENQWYWQKAGFTTFDEYWKSNTGEAFETWAQLEAMYNFAKISCPALFTITKDEASSLYEHLEYLRTIAPALPHGTNRHSRNLFTDDESLRARLMQAASWNDRRLSSASLERRMARLKRDNPQIAERLIGGEFIKETKAGKKFIDVHTAERLAYGEDFHEKAKKKKVFTRANSVLTTLNSIKNSEEVRNLMVALKANPLYRPYIKDEL